MIHPALGSEVVQTAQFWGLHGEPCPPLLGGICEDTLAVSRSFVNANIFRNLEPGVSTRGDTCQETEQ